MIAQGMLYFTVPHMSLGTPQGLLILLRKSSGTPQGLLKNPADFSESPHRVLRNP
jgi:hypothetical protein